MIDKFSELQDALNRDALFAGVDTSFIGRIKLFFHPSYCYKYIKILRKGDYYIQSKNPLIKIYGIFLKLKCHRLSAKLGFYIPKDVFGPGIYIPHFGSVIVNPNAIIGSNCQINNNVVIGQVNGKCPTIGDNVFIGSGAVICGNIKVGDNVWIGANSVVTKDIESGVMVAGVPAKVISKRDKNWVEVYLQNSYL